MGITWVFKNIKFIGVSIAVLILLYSLYSYHNTVVENEELKKNNAEQAELIKKQEALKDSLDKANAEKEKIYTGIIESYKDISKERNELLSLLNKTDSRLNKIAVKKPELLEKHINSGTKSAIDELYIEMGWVNE